MSVVLNVRVVDNSRETWGEERKRAKQEICCCLDILDSSYNDGTGIAAAETAETRLLHRVLGAKEDTFDDQETPTLFVAVFS